MSRVKQFGPRSARHEITFALLSTILIAGCKLRKIVTLTCDRVIHRGMSQPCSIPAAVYCSWTSEPALRGCAGSSFWWWSMSIASEEDLSTRLHIPVEWSVSLNLSALS